MDSLQRVVQIEDNMNGTRIDNPTKEEVIKFCSLIQTQLLGAIDRGAMVAISVKQDTKEVESPDYGNTIVDMLYVGARFMATFRERGM